MFVNIDQIIKNVGKCVRLRPIPRRFDGGPGGTELEALDRDWRITRASRKDGVTLELDATGHGVTLNWDNILEFNTDSVRGEQYGFLSLKMQIHLGGSKLWLEPAPIVPPRETDGQRKYRAVAPFKGKLVKLSQMNTGRNVILLGPVLASSIVEVFDCNEFSVTVGKSGDGGFKRPISLDNVAVIVGGDYGLELQERHG
ncbi:MAG TPA: hypothetical protein VGN17_00410 [Bryobacteraceae bacterium]